MRARPVSAAFAVALAGVLVAPGSVRAQSLDRVESLAAAGRADEARDELLAWWERSGGPASREERQRGLWLRGLLTVDPSQAALDYQRLVVEYPGGPWSAGALLRLAMAAREEGEVDRARTLLETVVRDYPSSPHRLEARRLLDAVASEPGRGPPAPSPSSSGASRPPDRSASPPATAPPPGAASPSGESPGTRGPVADPPEGTAVPDAVPGRGDWAVQLGAFSTESRARRLAERARAAGLDARLVRVEDSALYRVRVGRYTVESEASEARERVRGAGFDALVVRGANREAEVR